ncbi:MAG: ABC transporter ATP-binding protein [Candidatus Nanohaloarchaeota archaeon QJJ-7]|nr:ABC transporter ATP-binding protein [Candidatus Nanohaloarchaeota archaeon QJJ-7]
MTNALETRDLRKHYEMGDVTVKALEGVDIEVERGDFVSIMGPSGSGKSTLMHMLGLLDNPTSGRVIIDGTETGDLSDTIKARFRLAKIGFIFQFYSLLSGFSALENTYMPLLMNGTETNEAKERAKEALDKVGLSDRIQHTPSELSGGQRQRVAIARAIVNEPEIVLADEATSELDTETSRDIMDTFRNVAESGQTVITVNHEESLGQEADRIIWLEDGEIVDR